MANRYNVISADAHLEISPDRWTERVPARYRDYAPRLVKLADDDRALLYGAFLELADLLQGEGHEQRAILWRRRGSRAFRSEAEARNSE